MGRGNAQQMGPEDGGYSTTDMRGPRNAYAPKWLEDAQSQLREKAQQQGGGPPITGFPLPPQEQQGGGPTYSGVPGGGGAGDQNLSPFMQDLRGRAQQNYQDQWRQKQIENAQPGALEAKMDQWRKSQLEGPSFIEREKRLGMTPEQRAQAERMDQFGKQEAQNYFGQQPQGQQRPGWRGMPQSFPYPHFNRPGMIPEGHEGGGGLAPGENVTDFILRGQGQRPPSTYPPGVPGYPQTPRPSPGPIQVPGMPNPNQDWWQPQAPQGPYASGYQGPLARPAGWPDRGVGSNFSSPWAPRPRPQPYPQPYPQPQRGGAAGKGGGGNAQPPVSRWGNSAYDQMRDMQRRGAPAGGGQPGMSYMAANGGLVRGYQAGGGVNNAGKGGGGQAPAPPPPPQNSAGKGGSGTTGPGNYPGNYQGGYGQPWGQPNYGGYQGQPWGQPRMNYDGSYPSQPGSFDWYNRDITGTGGYGQQYRGQTDFTPPAPATQAGGGGGMLPGESMADFIRRGQQELGTAPVAPVAPAAPAAPAAKGWGHSAGPSINEDLNAAQAYLNQPTQPGQPQGNVTDFIQQGQTQLGGQAAQQERLARLAQMGVAAPTSEIGPGGVTDINQSGQANVTDFILQGQQAQQARQGQR